MDDLKRAQDRIRAALEGGGDKDAPARVRADGETLARTVHSLVHLCGVYSPDNSAFEAPAVEFAEALGRLLEALGEVSLVAVDDMLYVNDVRLRFKAPAEVGHDLCAELHRHRVGGVVWRVALEPSAARRMAFRLAAAPDPATPRAALASALAEDGIEGVVLAGLFRYRLTGEAEIDGAEPGRRAGEQAVRMMEKAWDEMSGGRLPNPLPVRRVVAEILEVGAGAEGLWDEPDSASPEAAHAAHVSQLALFLGAALGLSAATLQDLGVAAMLHDVGYTAREGARPKEGIAGFAPPFERHSTAGARLLLRQRGWSDVKLRRVAAVLHHHRDYSDSRGRPHLFARILRIADDYDNFTRARGGGLAPADALARIAGGAGTAYDPDLVQLFVNALGKWPPGSVLRLADGRTVGVISGARSERTFDRPRTKVIWEADGSTPEEPRYVDLAAEGEVAEVVR